MVEEVEPQYDPVPQLAEETQQPRRQPGNAQLERRRFPDGVETLLDLGARPGHDLLDTGGVDSPVLDQPFDGEPRHRAAERIEARQHDRLRRLVHDHVDTGRHLDRADIAALAPDDAALHVVVRQLDHRDDAVHEIRGRQPLNRFRHDAPGAAAGLELRLLLDAAHDIRRLLPRLRLDLAQQLAAGFPRRGSGDPLQPGPALQEQGLGLLLGRRDALLPLAGPTLAIIEIMLLLPQELELARDVALLLLEPFLEPLHLVALGARLVFEARRGDAALLLGFQIRLLESRLGPPLGVRQHLRGAAFGIRPEPAQSETRHQPAARGEDQQRDGDQGIPHECLPATFAKGKQRWDRGESGGGVGEYEMPRLAVRRGPI